jgi:AraC-like DNA-binding protein
MQAKDNALHGAAEATADHLQPVRFSTSAIKASEQFDAWREHCGAVADISPVLEREAGFKVGHSVWQLNAFAVSCATIPPANFVRDARQLRRDSVDHWFIIYPRFGGSKVRIGDKVLVTQPTTPLLLSLADSFDGQNAQCESCSLFIPRDALQGIVGALDLARNRTLDTPMAGLLGDYIQLLERGLPDLKQADIPAVADATKAMIAACLAPSSDRQAEAQGQIEIVWRERVRQLVEQRFRRPTLGPDELCRLLGISRSRLYRVSEPLGGVQHYIRRRRLRAAEAERCREGSVRPIFEIAESLGFADASSFYSAFRAEFGCSPSEKRAAAAQDKGESTPRPARTDGQPSDLGSLLRALKA